MDAETLIGGVYGAAGLPTGLVGGLVGKFGKYKSWPILGGRAIPSNALLFTNKRLFLIFIEVPASMGMNILTGGLVNINRDKVKQKVEEMIAGMPPEELLHTNTYNIAIPFDEIEEVNLRKWKEKGSIGDSFIIKTIDQQEYKYQFLDATDIPTLEQILLNLLMPKAVIESGKLVR